MERLTRHSTPTVEELANPQFINIPEKTASQREV
jgi:hypothetical protein